jgi:hypothetical protein
MSAPQAALSPGLLGLEMDPTALVESMAMCGKEKNT